MPKPHVTKLEGAVDARPIAVIRAGSTWLGQLLQLPAGHHVTGVHWNPQKDELMFVVSGPAMPMVPHGYAIPEIRPVCRFAPSTEAVLQIEWPNATRPA